MGCIVDYQGPGSQSVRQVTIDRQKLEQIADILGMSPAERQQIASGAETMHIRSARPTYPGTRPRLSHRVPRHRRRACAAFDAGRRPQSCGRCRTLFGAAARAVPGDDPAPVGVRQRRRCLRLRTRARRSADHGKIAGGPGNGDCSGRYLSRHSGPPRVDKMGRWHRSRRRAHSGKRLLRAGRFRRGRRTRRLLAF